MALNLTINPLDALVEKITAANTLALQIKSAKSDKKDNVDAILSASDDPKIVKFREIRATLRKEIETLQAKIVNAEGNIAQYAESLIPPVEEGFVLETAVKDFTAKRREITDMRKAMHAFGATDEQIDAALAERGAPEIVELKGNGSKSTKPAGETKRPRISAATVDGEAVFSDKEKTKVDFTTLAKVLKVSADDAKKAAFAAAKTEDLNSLAAGTVVSFTVGEKEVTVTISGEKPGRKPNAETPKTETVSEETVSDEEETSSETSAETSAEETTTEETTAE